MSADPNLQERIQVFRNMLQADPENELANFTLGKLYLQSGDHENAETTLRKTLELNPRHSMSYNLLGQLLIQVGRRDEAVALLEKGIGIAHEKGEFQPRNQMQDQLRQLGIAPPEPTAAPRPAGGEAEVSGNWVCSRCGQTQARLEEAPIPGDLGDLVLRRICQPCWREWIAMSIKVINEYRLNLASGEGNRIYEAHMVEFLGLPTDRER